MPASITDSLSLNNGTRIPLLGLGTWRVGEDAQAEQAVRTALEVGYRHIDTAAIYGNERGVGKGVRESKIPRQEVFVTTKLWNDDVRQGRAAMLKAFDLSMQKLNIEYIDLYLMHWPIPGKFVQAWQVMEEICATGKVKAIGVSNFLLHHLQELLPKARIIPAMNQIEFHPRLQQKALQEFLHAHQIAITAWAPLMKGKVLDIPQLQQLAARHKRTVVQVVLRWMIQKKIVAIPKSVNRPRIEENAQLYDFELPAKDLALIDALDTDERIGAHPDTFSF